MFENTNKYHIIILLVIISIILSIIYFYILPPKETLINTDSADEFKKNISKCCDDEKCYRKPHYLNMKECNDNIMRAQEQLLKQYQQQFTKDDYLTLLNNLDGINIDNTTPDDYTVRKLKEKLINLSSDHYDIKKNLSKCCTGERCYNKPSFLNINDCKENIKDANDNLFKSYQQQFTEDEYLILLNNLNNRKLKSIDNLTADPLNPTVYVINESIDNPLPNDTNTKINNDSSFLLPGYSF